MRYKITKFVLPVLLFFLLSSELISRSYFQQIHQEQKDGKLTYTESLYLRALGMYLPDQIPDEYRTFPVDVVKSGFGTAFEIRRNWQNFSASQREMLANYFFRPEMDSSCVSPRGLFRIHYNFSGSAAVDTTDSDFDGIPDYVEAVADIADSVYHKEVEIFGLKAPLSDNNTDGPEWDIYIQNFSRIYGQTIDEQQMTSNPDTYAGYMEIDNNFTHTPTRGLDGARVTIAHEFFHLIHMAYHLRSTNFFTLDDLFIMEASAVWMEDFVYDTINDYYYYLDKFFQYNNRPFDFMGDNHHYALCIWFHYLQQKLGSPDIVREMWEAIVDFPALDALNYVLSNQYQIPFEDALTEFYGWNIMTGTRADTSLYYPEGDAYPEVTLDHVIDFVMDNVFETSIQRLATRYFQFNDEENNWIITSPVNINRSAASTTGSCQVLIHKGDPKPFYKLIGNELYAAIVTEDETPWQMTTVTSIDDQLEFAQFQELKEGFSATICGQVFHDLNSDGTFQENEPGIASVVVHLIEAGTDSIVGTDDDIQFFGQMTDTSGAFCFSKLYGGNYYFSIDLSTLPTGMIFSTRNLTDRVEIHEEDIVENIYFGFRSFEENKLPAAIPHPFFPAIHEHLKIPYTCQEPGYVYITFFSSAGFRVISCELRIYDPGTHFFEWDGLDENKESLPAGVYFYVIRQNEKILRKNKIVMIR